MTRIIVVASHRRSGTHLMLDSLRANAPGVHRRFMNLDRIEPRHPEHIPIEEFDERLRSREGTVLVKTHSLPDPRAWQTPEAGRYAAELLADAPVIYAHRDGRDTLVSLYHYMASFSDDIARQPFAAFIRHQQSAPDAPALSRAAYWQHHVLTWVRAKPRALGGFAEMQADFDATLRRVAERLELPLLPTIAPVTLDADDGIGNAVKRVLGGRRRTGRRRSTAIRPRGGSTGTWQDMFDAEDVAFFEHEAAEGMRTLGYR